MWTQAGERHRGWVAWYRWRPQVINNTWKTMSIPTSSWSNVSAYDITCMNQFLSCIYGYWRSSSVSCIIIITTNFIFTRYSTKKMKTQRGKMTHWENRLNIWFRLCAARRCNQWVLFATCKRKQMKQEDGLYQKSSMQLYVSLKTIGCDPHRPPANWCELRRAFPLGLPDTMLHAKDSSLVYFNMFYSYFLYREVRFPVNKIIKCKRSGKLDNGLKRRSHNHW